MKSIRLIFALLAALTSVQATGHAIPNAMSSAEIAGLACVCLNGCGASCDAMRQDGGVCLRSAACAFGSANVLAVDRSDFLAAPSDANRFFCPPMTSYFNRQPARLSGLRRLDLSLTILSRRVSRVLVRSRVQRCRFKSLSASMNVKPTGDQVTKHNLTLAGAVLAVGTTVFGGTAYAGATISDTRYWPNEAGSSLASAITHAEKGVQSPGAVPRWTKDQHRRDKTFQIRH